MGVMGGLGLGALWLLVEVWDLGGLGPGNGGVLGGPGGIYALGAWAWTCGWGPGPWEWGNFWGLGFGSLEE